MFWDAINRALEQAIFTVQTLTTWVQGLEPTSPTAIAMVTVAWTLTLIGVYAGVRYFLSHQ